jgi:hypothetical protein
MQRMRRKQPTSVRGVATGITIATFIAGIIGPTTMIGRIIIDPIRITHRLHFSLASDLALGLGGNRRFSLAARRKSLRQQHDALRAGFAVFRDFEIFG